MLGVCLLFVGIVLINNGMCTLYNVDGKSTAVMNIFTGGLSLFINFVNLVQGNYYAAGTGLLFCFTYLWGTAFVEDIMGKKLGKFVPVLQVIEGVITAWVPGVMLLLGVW